MNLVLVLGVGFLEVFLGIFNSWLDSSGTWGPVTWQNGTVLVSPLETFDQSQGFFDVSTDWQVVDGNVSNDTLWIDDEQTSQSNTFVFDQDTVVSGQLVVSVSQQWDVNWT